MKRISLLLAALAAPATACGADGGGGGGDKDSGSDAPVTVPGDAGTDSDTLSLSTTLVFVDGLVTGATKDQTGTAMTLSDVRVCIRDALSNAYTYPYAQPDSTPMPLTNYPGVQLGRGISFGHTTSTSVILEVYRAADLYTDATWAADRSGFKCDLMGCSGSGLPCQKHVTLGPIALSAGVDVVALVDDTANGTVQLAPTVFKDTTYAGGPNSIWGTVVDFSGWHAGSEIGAYYGNFTTGAGLDKTIVQPLEKPPLPPGSIVDSIDSYETSGIRFDAWANGHPFDRFGQSLDSIAYVSNATLTPPAFFGVRQNFIIALVGDPNDPTSVQSLGGRDPSFDGRGLHIIAIPY